MDETTGNKIQQIKKLVFRMKRFLFIAFFLVFVFLSCNNVSSGKYVYTIAHVDSTKKIHWGKGFYKQRVFYCFYIDTLKVNSVWDFKLGRSYSLRFAIGDSVYIRYELNDPEQSEIIKVAFKKKKIKL